jgi:hypothetical protein
LGRIVAAVAAVVRAIATSADAAAMGIPAVDVSMIAVVMETAVAMVIQGALRGTNDTTEV